MLPKEAGSSWTKLWETWSSSGILSCTPPGASFQPALPWPKAGHRSWACRRGDWVPQMERRCPRDPVSVKHLCPCPSKSPLARSDSFVHSVSLSADVTQGGIVFPGQSALVSCKAQWEAVKLVLSGELVQQSASVGGACAWLFSSFVLIEENIFSSCSYNPSTAFHFTAGCCFPQGKAMQ